MSIFIVHPTHIDVLLSVAVNGPKGSTSTWHGPYVNELLVTEGLTGPVRKEVADQAGRELLRECIKSVSFLADSRARRLPGPVPNPLPGLYEWTNFGQILSPVESCRAIACYQAQASRHPGWAESGARWFCERLLGLVVAEIDGYSGAEWEWTPEKVFARFDRRDL